MIAVWGWICKTKTIAVKDLKRKDLKSSARKKNFWQTFSVGVRNDFKFLKEWQKKGEEAESHSSVFTFFKSMALTVTQFPPKYNCKNTSENVSWLRKWNQKLYMSKTRRELRVFLFTVFLLLHLITKWPVIHVTVNFRQHPASYLLKCCPLQQLIPAATCLLQNQHQRQNLLKMERKEEAVQLMNLTPTIPALLMSSSSSDWYMYTFGLWLLLIV